MRNVQIAVLGLLFSSAAHGVEPRSPAETALLAVDDQERQMVLTDNATAMDNLAHPNLHINAPTNEVLERPEFIRRLQQKIIAFENLKRIPERVFITGDVGIIMGREEVLPTASSESGQLFGVRPLVRRYTNIYLREAGRWRFLARHANVVAESAPNK